MTEQEKTSSRDIDRLSRYLIAEHNLDCFTNAYNKFLSEKDHVHFWKKIESHAKDDFAVGRDLEWELLTTDNFSPNTLLFKMMEITKSQESSTYNRLLPLYRIVVLTRTRS